MFARCAIVAILELPLVLTWRLTLHEPLQKQIAQKVSNIFRIFVQTQQMMFLIGK